MKSFSMNKVLGSIKRRPTFAGSEETSADPGSGTPEAIAERCVRQFCQSVGSATVCVAVHSNVGLLKKT
ncbi:hypothetical protein N656DRAFT_773811 [Canariomyces notabilis]|uniref:Uncharacterized protein n=1 Tax=Canariomyces notabilis TaxID=2074819 RepID=A0AAN6YXR2_9PEZI|nr:hypothetical protein N656DRAFT_773811 [Canariomyces arenarius]